MAETTFYARKSHPVQTKPNIDRRGQRWAGHRDRSPDDPPREWQKSEITSKTPETKWTRAEFQRKHRKVRSSSKKEPISKAEVKNTKDYLKVHDLALVGDNQQISFKQYLADQNDDMSREGSRLHQEKPGHNASKREMDAWQARWDEFDARNRASLRKPKAEELEQKRQKYGFDKEDQD